MLLREKNKITYSHFIMSVLVILIHSINNESRFQNIFSIDNGIGQFAVPLFFIISGFLFFRNLKTFDEAMLKVGKRVHTVLVPYILWNLIYYVIHLLIKPSNGAITIDLYNAVINHAYNPSFWFIYQLMLLMLISPILFNFYKKLKYGIIFLVVMCILIALNFDIPFINEDAIVYYTGGAVLARLYNEYKLDLISKRNILFTLPIAIVVFILNRILLRYVNIGMIPVSCFTLSVVLVRLTTAMFIFYFIDLFFKYEKVYGFMENTFFLYAIHYMIVKAMIIVMKYIMYRFLPTNTFIVVETIVFILSPVVCVVISYYLSRFLLAKAPKFYCLLTGNRK